MQIYSIYKITNRINNKIYIGYTSNILGHRFTTHCSTKKPKYQERSVISLAIEKYGKENFICEVIYQSTDYHHAREIEGFFIKEYNSLTQTQGGWGYNVDLGGTGHKRSIETIERHRAKITGRKQSESHKRNKASAIQGEKNGMYGIRGEAHHRYGKSHTPETINSMKESLRKYYETHSTWNKGKSIGTFSESHKKALKAAKTYKYIDVTISSPDGRVDIIQGRDLDSYLKSKSLNNFMSLSIKKNLRPIKGYTLLTYTLNPEY